MCVTNKQTRGAKKENVGNFRLRNLTDEVKVNLMIMFCLTTNNIGYLSIYENLGSPNIAENRNSFETSTGAWL